MGFAAAKLSGNMISDRGQAMRRSNIIGLLIFGAMATATEADAQAAQRFSKTDLKVLPALGTLREPRAGQRYQLGDTLRLTRRNHLSRARSDEVANRRSFEVRVFRTAGQHALPQPWYSLKDDCDIFLTLVYPIGPFRGDTLKVGSLISRNWLTWQGTTPSSGHFLLVVQATSKPDPKSSRKPNWQLFRLRHDMRSTYFAQGLHFEVAPRPGFGPPQNGPDEKWVRNSLEAVAQQVAAEFYCYRPKIVAGAADGDALAFVACEVRSAPTAG